MAARSAFWDRCRTEQLRVAPDAVCSRILLPVLQFLFHFGTIRNSSKMLEFLMKWISLKFEMFKIGFVLN
ncbi:hypothetical protein JTE90_013341 [Oedothorax gibbosus]|uniref:Uncharacterized protein n=1 Tax=Oedothorax gibbosus TaxID=931172 RepID=A0AAV6VG17_9ARAC|nr:hypothetical protein JTE90_013341 [Oedothorax gibbosus]